MHEQRFEKLERPALFEAVLPAGGPAPHIVKSAQIRFAPGQPTGFHRHPMSTCGVVTEGRFVIELEGENVRELRAGDAFFEPAGHTIRRFDNASEYDPAEIVCFYLTDDSARPSIEMLGGGMDEQLGKQ